MNSAICSAIRERALIQFTYEGGTRTVEPYCHGITTAGHEALRAYQVSGYSESGNPVGWKLFTVSKILRITKTGETVSSNRPGYNPQDRGMSSIHCHV